jgi:hypothetical protein
MFTGTVHTLDLPITQEQIDAYNNGMLLQQAFPNLDKSDREFIKTGVTQKEWDKVFGESEDDR